MTAIGRRPRSLLLSIFTISLLLYHNHALSTPKPTEFRLVSWNLLAPMYAPPKKYRNTDPACLPWSYRQPRILARLKECNPDIICLQEMQLDLWEDFLAQMEGYHGVLQKEKSHKRDLPVNAVLVRDGCAEIVRTESRSRAFIVVLKPSSGVVNDGDGKDKDKDKDSPMIYLANVHLEAGYEKDETRYFQIRSLMKRLEQQVLRDTPDHANANNGNDHSEPAIILAGDFNMRNADDIIYDLLTLGHLPDDDDDDDLVADTLPQPFMPLLPLRDAYRQCPPVPGPVLMTYRGGAVLDYIWLSDCFSIQETWQAHPMQAQSLQRTWPNPNQPSDHLPVGVVLSRHYN
jgi:CCR4-NOT transcription complex subunit 6